MIRGHEGYKILLLSCFLLFVPFYIDKDPFVFLFQLLRVLNSSVSVSSVTVSHSQSQRVPLRLLNLQIKGGWEEVQVRSSQSWTIGPTSFPAPLPFVFRLGSFSRLVLVLCQHYPFFRREMLAAGRSRPWPQTLYHLTGEREMKASAILEYFSPLQAWLLNYRTTKGYSVGWKKKKAFPASPVTSGVRKTLSSSTSRTQIDTSDAKPVTDSMGVSTGNKDNNETADVIFPAVKDQDDAISLGKPDLKAALADMEPNLSTPGQRSENIRDYSSLLNPKSAIFGAKPMFVPNRIKDQLDLG